MKDLIFAFVVVCIALAFAPACGGVAPEPDASADASPDVCYPAMQACFDAGAQ